jgi:hypothetical protein
MSVPDTSEDVLFWATAAAGTRNEASRKSVFMSALDGDAGEKLRNKEDTEATWGCRDGSH